MDEETREIRAVRHRRRRLAEKGVDLIVIGLITFIAGFVCGVVWMSLAVR